MVATFIVAALDWNATPLLDLDALHRGAASAGCSSWCAVHQFGLGNTMAVPLTGGSSPLLVQPEYTASTTAIVSMRELDLTTMSVVM